MGFEAIEIWVPPRAGSSMIEMPLKAEEIEEIKGAASKYNVTVSALSCHINHLQPNLEERKQLSQFFKDVLTASSQLGVPVVTTLSGDPLPEKSDDETWSEWRHEMGQQVDYATNLGVKIAVESCHDQNLAHNVPAMDRMFKEIPSKTLGVNFDPSHCVWQGINYIKAVKLWRDRIYHAHAKDAEILRDVLELDGIQGVKIVDLFGRKLKRPSWWRFRTPGWGEVDWRKLLTTYKEIGYDYVISLEHEDPVFTPEEAARRTIAFLKQLL